ncbi:hypothetical protein D3C84_1206010 [compost metagenome]
MMLILVLLKHLDTLVSTMTPRLIFVGSMPKRSTIIMCIHCFLVCKVSLYQVDLVIAGLKGK